MLCCYLSCRRCYNYTFLHETCPLSCRLLHSHKKVQLGSGEVLTDEQVLPLEEAVSP